MNGLTNEDATRSSARFLRARLELFPESKDIAEKQSNSDSHDKRGACHEGQLKPHVTSLSELVQFNARNNPHHLFCAQNTCKGNSLHISFLELQNAVAACSHWLKRIVNSTDGAGTDSGPASSKGGRPTVAIFLESDISIFIYLTAILGCNMKCVLLSARLSPKALHHLLATTATSLVLVSSLLQPVLEQALSNGGQRFALNAESSSIYDNDGGRFRSKAQLAPPLSEFLFFDAGKVANDPKCNGNLNTYKALDANDTSALYLHSSGSTGLPKPIGLAHRYILGYAACHTFAEDSDESQRGVNVSTLPLYHGFGLLAPCLSLSIGKPCFLPPLSTTANVHVILPMLRKPEVTSFMTVPSILDDIIQIPGIDYTALKKLDFVAVGGGALKLGTGRHFQSQGVKILNHFGATEIGALAPIFRPEPGYDWRFLRIRQDIGLDLLPIGDVQDGRQHVKLVGHPFGWRNPFELPDLLELKLSSSVPEVLLLSRLDDVIVLATGEKVLPAPYERAVVESDLVTSAIIFGEGRFQVGILIELTAIAASLPRDLLLERLWELICRENRHADGHAQVSSKAAILVKPEAKSIPRTDKGSFQRKQVYNVFGDEIMSVYQNLENEAEELSALNLTMSDLYHDVRTMVLKSTNSYKPIMLTNDETDFMEAGLDSLGLARLRRMLRAYTLHTPGLQISPDEITPAFIYLHTTVAKVVTAFRHPTPEVPESAEQRSVRCHKVADEYKSSTAQPATAKPYQYCVLITGSTGSLGSRMLKYFAQRSQVNRIFCLVRKDRTTNDHAPGAGPFMYRKEDYLHSQRLDLSLNCWKKVEFYVWQPGKKLLGLEKSNYDRIASAVTHVYHGAWPMNFNLPLRSFKPHLDAVVELATLTKKARELRPTVVPRMIFISSIAVCGRTPILTGCRTALEQPLGNPLASLPMGYAEAKWASEQVLEGFAQDSVGDVEYASARTGQISGCDLTSYWSTSEHLARLFKISQRIGFLPDLPGTASWLPVNKAAIVIGEILLDSGRMRNVYHIENPVRQSWSDILQAVKVCNCMRGIGMKPYGEWLREALSFDSSLKDGTIIDLAPFFNDHFLRMSTGGLVLDTSEARQASPTLVSIGAVSINTVVAYMKSWEDQGFLKVS